jgi:hypothetical protein
MIGEHCARPIQAHFRTDGVFGQDSADIAVIRQRRPAHFASLTISTDIFVKGNSYR